MGVCECLTTQRTLSNLASKGPTKLLFFRYMFILYIYIYIYTHTHTHTHIYILHAVKFDCSLHYLPNKSIYQQNIACDSLNLVIYYSLIWQFPFSICYWFFQSQFDISL